MPKKHYIKETLDSGHRYGDGRLHTFMTVCGRKMRQSSTTLRVFQSNFHTGNKGTHDATEVTCKECLLDARVRAEIAMALERRINNEVRKRTWSETHSWKT